MRHRLPNPQAHPSAGVTITLWVVIAMVHSTPTYVTPEDACGAVRVSERLSGVS